MKRQKTGKNRKTVAIVGGGPAGLSLALALGQAKLDVVLLDSLPKAKKVDAKTDGRTTAFSLGSKRIFDALGIWPALQDAACPMLDIHTTDDDAWLHYNHRLIGSEPMGFILDNHRVLKALHQAVEQHPHITVQTGVKVTDISHHPAHASLTLESGPHIDAELIVGADGRRSFVRESAGIQTRTVAYPHTAIVCIATVEKPHNNVAFERFHPAGPFAVLPMLNKQVSIVWTEPHDLIDTVKSLSDEDFCNALQDRFGDHLGKFTLASDRWYYPLSLVYARKFTALRTALIADAAHAIHPIAGQGLNLGLRDVASLAELIIETKRLGLDAGQADMLDRYEKWRRPDVMHLVGSTDGLTWLFSNDLPGVSQARKLGLKMVEKSPTLKSLFMKKAMGTSTPTQQPKLLMGQKI